MPNEMYMYRDCLKKDQRYSAPAYTFVRDSLRYATDMLAIESDALSSVSLDDDADATRVIDRHVTGQQLCEAIRQHALRQFGFMARVVMNQWGIYNTTDFGNIVYNMIDAGLMSCSEHDRQSDFDNVFDFENEFDRDFVISDQMSRPLR
ncbi:MAG TPA: hypothetical protein PKD64_13630 [Pirellulaceae bacterium]|nr:hypothetical protein [Pirellulaceae bacterium]HMO93226.1 hypothetical protein [Pirellulaceae bacterium]HMP70057.1 hypothetical protein [Pirellulaceae bacterium]